jgi:hypothetical protein
MNTTIAKDETVTKREVEDWLDNPLVKRAFESVPDETPLLDVLEKLLETLHGLEDRFPGVPFRTILSAHEPSPDRLRIIGTLRRTGATDEDIQLVFGNCGVIPTDADLVDEKAFEMVAAGATTQDLIDAGYTRTAAENISAVKNPLTKSEQVALDLLLREDVSFGEAARRLGFSRVTPRRAMRKHRFQEWCAKNMQRPFSSVAATAFTLLCSVMVALSEASPL